MVTKTKKAFVPIRPIYTLGEKDYELKLTSSFNFHELTQVAQVEEDMEGILEQARSDGKIDEEGNIDSTSVKYTLPWIEATYRILVIHFQNAITVDDLKNLDADEIAEIRIFLEAAQMKVQAEREKRQGLMEQKAVLDQKNNGKT